MRSNFRKAISAITAVVALCAIAGLSAPANAAAGPGTTYYVDSGGGSDSNSGTDPAAPWASLEKVNATTFGPGDEVLLKAGATWTGQLTPQGSGAEGSPIVIDRYGEGALPRIDGAGVLGGTVELKNQEHFEIRNLEITNLGDCRCGNARSGILVLNNGGGKLEHIHIIGNYVHDVNSTFWHFVEWEGLRYDAHEFGGIAVNAHGGTTADTYNDVLIEGNRLESVGRTGIMPWNDHVEDELPETAPAHAMTNVVIRGNSLTEIDADGIFVAGTSKALIEYNTVNGASRLTPTNTPPEDVPPPGNLFRPSVAIWTLLSWDTVIQYNEAYNTHDSGGDNQGFDIDRFSRGAVVQYNYSHDNAGGFLLVMYDTADSVIRYNISENDGPARDRLIHFINIGGAGNTHFYNNVFYVPAENPVDLSRDRLTEKITFQNNIFYWLGGGNYPTGGNWDSNVFYGTHPASEPNDLHKLTSDPKMVAPGTGGIGRDTLGGYRLQPSSPALDSGVLIADNGGKDFWGSPVPVTEPPNRGAFQGDDKKKPTATLVSPTSAGPFPSLSVRVDATDGIGLKRIVANIYKDGVLVKSTQTAMKGSTSGSHNATVALPDGAYTVKYNAEDLAGNISKTGTFAFTIDATAPTATVKDGSQFTVKTGETYDLVSFKLHDAGKVDRVELNGVVKNLTDNAWSDVNFIKPGTFGAVKGQNTLVVYDVAGNSSTVTFTLN